MSTDINEPNNHFQRKKQSVPPAAVYTIAFAVVLPIFAGIAFLWSKFDQVHDKVHRLDVSFVGQSSTSSEKIAALDQRLIRLESALGLQPLLEREKAGVPVGSDPRTAGLDESRNPTAILVKDTIHVIDSKWGIGINNWRDVTSTIAAICEDEVMCSKEIDLTKFHDDPLPGFAKELLVEYRCGENVPKTIVTKSHAAYRLTLSCF
jgi:hypothetical protein